MNAGEEFDLSDDAGILAIKSPQDSVKGPFRVVFKSVDER
jgi:hypothetical protein